MPSSDHIARRVAEDVGREISAWASRHQDAQWGEQFSIRRAHAISLASPYTRMSKPDAEALLGITIPRRLWEAAKRHRVRGGGPYAPPGRWPGRAGYDRDILAHAWRKHAYPSYSGADTVALRGGSKASFAMKISQELGVSLSTAYRGCPPDVVVGVKRTDLCPLCERLRRIRLEALGCAEAYGQKDAKQLYDEAGPGEEAVGAHGGVIKAYEWHEDVRENQDALLKSHVEAANRNNVVVVFDYAGAALIEHYRGEAKDWWNPTKVGIFGAVFYDGNKSPYTIFVLGSTQERSSFWSRLNLEAAMDSYYATRPPPRGTCKVELWCDTASAFRSMEFVTVLQSSQIRARRVAINFHAEYHGKSIADVKFSHAKNLLRRTHFNDTSGPDMQVAVATVLSNDPNAKALWLPREGVEAQRARRSIARIQKISATYRIEKLGDGYLDVGLLTQDRMGQMHRLQWGRVYGANCMAPHPRAQEEGPDKVHNDALLELTDQEKHLRETRRMEKKKKQLDLLKTLKAK